MSQPETIIIKKPHDIFTSIKLGVALVFCAIILGVMLYGILFDNNGRTDDYLYVITSISLIATIIVRQLLWNIFGRDEVKFLEKTIKISRKGAFFHRSPTELSYEKFFGFEVLGEKNNSSWKEHFGLEKENIVAHYDTYRRQMGQGLEEERAIFYVNVLNDKLCAAKNKVLF